jgi:hypothetical protein
LPHNVGVADGSAEPSVWKCLSYATAGEIWHTARVHLLVWAFIVGFSVVIGLGGLYLGKAALHSTEAMGIPRRWFWACVFCVGLWLVRGTRIEIPDFGFKSWLGCSASFLLFLFVSDYLPTWATVGLCYLPMAGGIILEELVAKGRARFLSENTTFSSQEQ